MKLQVETQAQVFSCEFCEISQKTFFTEHLLETASENFLNVGELWERTSEISMEIVIKTPKIEK